MWELLNDKLTDDEYSIVISKLSSATAQAYKVLGELWTFSEQYDTDFPGAERHWWNFTGNTSEYWTAKVVDDGYQHIYQTIHGMEEMRREFQDLIRG